MALFLILSGIFAALFIRVYPPMGVKEVWNSIGGVSFHVYTAVVVGIGYITLTASHILLYKVLKKHELKWWGYVMWIVGEIILFTLILTILAYNLQDDNYSFLQLAVRICRDIVEILIIPFTISGLIFLVRAKDKEAKALLSMLSKKKAQPSSTVEACMFYNQNGKFAFSTKKENVLYIESADNYVNVHYLNENRVERMLLHNTLKNIADSYTEEGLIRCHRGYMVNINKVKLVRKQKDALVLELYDTDAAIPVSKTYSDKVLEIFTKEAQIEE